jgi:predicted tellurium resistance membrane protein TerC
MKLNNKQGLYGVIMIILSMLGLSIFLFDFNLKHCDNYCIYIVVGIKVLGLLITYFGIKIWKQHFKNQEK